METPVSTITSTGDLGGRKVAMSFDENSLAHLMSVLTDLYSDPQGAVIREYSTNARDSHVEAGNRAPIEITTPSSLSPYFKVRDYGVGLSVDDIVEMYSKYGASTKRGTNEQVGMLGIGAKSALTLVPQFNVTSVKGNTKIFVSVSRSSDGSGQMEIIDTKWTDEPNGVEISIPIPRNADFASKCSNFFRFWEKGTVLVNGKEPDRIDGRWIGDKIVIDRSLDQDYIVMGNVPYPVKDGLGIEGYYYRHMGIVAFVDIGEVNFTPSREQLHYTIKTKDTIQRIKSELKAGLISAATAEIDAAATHSEAWKVATEWQSTFRSTLNSLSMTYKGQYIPRSIPLDDKYRLIDLFAQRAGRGWSVVSAITPDSHKQYMFIMGFNESLKMSPVQRERALKYAEQQNLSITSAAVTNQPMDKFPVSPWISNVHVVDWKVIADIKIDRAKQNRAIKTSPYELFQGGWQYIPTTTMDLSKDIIYVSPAEHKRPDFLWEMYPDAQIVMLAMNRWDKFKRDFPTAVHYRIKVNKDKDDLVKQFTHADKVLWHHNDTYYSVRYLDHSKIDDPDLAAFVRVLTGDRTLSDAATKARKLPREVGIPQPERPDNPLHKYPLAANIGRADKDHIIWYLNTFYATLKEN